MNDEQLVKLVREYSALYDLFDQKYVDNSSKQDVWNKIDKNIKANGSLCKSRWKSLKKHTARNGQKKIKFYKYSQQLNFLKTYFSEKETKRHVGSRREDENQHDPETESENKEKEEKEEIHFDIEELHETGDNLQEEQSAKNTTEFRTQLLKPKLMKKIAVPQKQVVAKLMEYLITRNEKQVASNQPSVDACLAGLASTLNPYYLNFAKSEIFATVQKYDMKMLEQQHLHQESVLNFNRKATSQSDNSSTSSKSTSIQLLPSKGFHEHSTFQD